MEQDTMSGIVFDMERFSTHDGPGIRTVVYLKGCPLRCEWCASPESQSMIPRLGYLQEICVDCGRCAGVCPQGTYFLEQKEPDFTHCTSCFRCVDACLYNARIVYGRRMRVSEVVGKVMEDSLFYKNSGGGVTLSGGEVSMQPDFAARILKECRENGIHTAVETCGCTQWDAFSAVIRYVDYLMFDIKHMDSAVHRRYTGAGNRQILENAEKASRIVPEMVVRMPIIPGVNDSLENVEHVGNFVRQNLHQVNRIDLLPYHSIGESKSRNIGRRYPFRAPYELAAEHMDALRAKLRQMGLDVRIET